MRLVPLLLPLALLQRLIYMFGDLSEGIFWNFILMPVEGILEGFQPLYWSIFWARGGFWFGFWFRLSHGIHRIIIDGQPYKSYQIPISRRSLRQPIPADLDGESFIRASL